MFVGRERELKALKEVYEKNGFGILVDFSEHDIIKGIEELKTLCNGDVSARMHKLFAEKYSWEIMEKRLIKLYRNLGTHTNS